VVKRSGATRSTVGPKRAERMLFGAAARVGFTKIELSRGGHVEACTGGWLAGIAAKGLSRPLPTGKASAWLGKRSSATRVIASANSPQSMVRR
jgi:hypothetical protein